jgi:LemA protein
MRIRARGFDALGSVEKHLKAYAAAVQEHLEDSRPMPQGWQQLLEALAVLEGAFKAARATPLAIGPLEGLTQQLQVVQQAWLALCDAPADLAGPAVPQALVQAWDDATQQVHSARGGYNQIVARYNEAIGQFPARLVVGVMGFQPAGTL